jgi:hypothetical protein
MLGKGGEVACLDQQCCLLQGNLITVVKHFIGNVLGNMRPFCESETAYSFQGVLAYYDYSSQCQVVDLNL